MPQKSVGHIAFAGDFEFYEFGGNVYRAPFANAFDVRAGVRFGRFESTRAAWEHFGTYVLSQYERSES